MAVLAEAALAVVCGQAREEDALAGEELEEMEVDTLKELYACEPAHRHILIQWRLNTAANAAAAAANCWELS